MKLCNLTASGLLSTYVFNRRRIIGFLTSLLDFFWYFVLDDSTGEDLDDVGCLDRKEDPIRTSHAPTYFRLFAQAQVIDPEPCISAIPDSAGS